MVGRPVRDFLLRMLHAAIVDFDDQHPTNGLACCARLCLDQWNQMVLQYDIRAYPRPSGTRSSMKREKRKNRVGDSVSRFSTRICLSGGTRTVAYSST